MADGGDALNTLSGKEARNTVSDGPVTDPASSTKVNYISNSTMSLKIS